MSTGSLKNPDILRKENPTKNVPQNAKLAKAQTVSF